MYVCARVPHVHRVQGTGTVSVLAVFAHRVEDEMLHQILSCTVVHVYECVHMTYIHTYVHT